MGAHVVDELVQSGGAVRVLELTGVDASHLPGGVEVVRGDVASADDVARAVTGCDAVVHLAANAQLWSPDASVYERVNHQGARNVLAAARAAGVERFVHVSSEAVLAGPRGAGEIDESAERSIEAMAGPYSRSKWRADRAVAEAASQGFAAIIVTPTVPVGPGDRRRTPPTRLIEAFLNGKVPASLHADLPLVDVRDAAKGIVAALDRGEPGKRYLVAGENWTTTRLFEALAETTGRKPPRWRAPYPVALLAGYAEQAACRVRGGQPLGTVEGVRLARRSLRFDDAWSRRQLDLHPRPVMDALRDAVAWLRDNRNAG